MRSIVRVDVQQLRQLPNGPFIIDFALFGRQHAVGHDPATACAETAATWTKELWLFRRTPSQAPLYVVRTTGEASKRATCWTHLDPRWLPSSVSGRDAFVRDDSALVVIDDWLVLGPRSDVEATLAVLQRPMKGVRSSLFDRPALFAAKFDGPFAISEASSGWSWASLEPPWLRSEAEWEFETTEAANGWVSGRTKTAQPDLELERGTVVQGTEAKEYVHLPIDSASAKRVVSTLHGLMRTGRPSYLSSSLPCAPVSYGTLSPEGVQSALLHAKGAQRCYEELLRRNPDASGKMLVDLRVEADGSIFHTGVLESEFEDESFHACVLEHVQAWTIPSRPDGPLQIHIPFSFKPRKKDE